MTTSTAVRNARDMKDVKLLNSQRYDSEERKRRQFNKAKPTITKRETTTTTLLVLDMSTTNKQLKTAKTVDATQ